LLRAHINQKKGVTMNNAKPKFLMGQTVITSNAQNTLDAADVLIALARHGAGDWGSVCPDDRKANEQALLEGCRLLSVYKDRNGTAFWIITEADRSATTVLLPEDY
jgi:hypothetical protein